MTVITEDAVIKLKDLKKILNETEDLSEHLFELSEDNIEFLFDEDDEDFPIKMKINSEKFSMTGEAVSQALAFAKIPKSIVEVYDIDLILPLMNWYYSEKGGERKALVKDKKILSFALPGTEIYSTVDIVDEMVRALDNFDITQFHFERVHHTLNETQFCLVAPHQSYDLEDGDVLRAGVMVTHSVIGKKPLVMRSYISRDYHDNGMISAEVEEKWNRKKGKKAEDIPEDVTDDADHYDVYTWAYDTADTVFRAFKRESKAIKELSDESMGNHAGTLFNDVFDKNSLPVAVRKLIREEYVDQPGQTLYDLWNAITLTANRTELEDNVQVQNKVMLAAGKLAAHSTTCSSCHRLTEEAS